MSSHISPTLTLITLFIFYITKPTRLIYRIGSKEKKCSFCFKRNK
uniref:ATP-dependent Clp protease ATP-binding subunit n=1 Tax=Staphylococcus phage HS15 TaxID=3056405 RepID=A0AA50ACQ9_9VIRU|nr:MAG: ATP-dependent Clp protease ATP-binding subunit [Staphylococcus phage HS15]